MRQIFQNVISLLFSADKEIFILAFTTLRFAAASVLISSAIGIPVGLILSFGVFPGKKIITIIVNGLMAVPTVVIGLFVFSLFSHSGLFSFTPILFPPAAVILGQSLFAAPVVISLTISGLNRIDNRFKETLFTLCVGRLRRYLLAAREGRDVIFHAVLTSFGRVVGEVGISMMLGGNIRWYTRTLTTSIVLETGKGNFELGLAMGVILLLIAVFVYTCLYLVVERGKTKAFIRNR